LYLFSLGIAMPKNKVVLAYSGGLDTSVAIKWLQETYHVDVIAMIADLGEGKDLDQIQQKALDIGALACHVVDLKQEFANDYLAKALKANALYEGVYPLISALSRPLIAKKLIEIAKSEQAFAVAHGCTGKGNDQVRFDVALNTLNSKLKIIAPVRDNPMSREQAISYAKKNHIPLPIDLENPFSIDMNLWGRSCECGELENPWTEPPEAAFELTANLANWPDKEQIIEIDFTQGIPTAFNGQKLALHELITQLNEIAGVHGVGRIDHVENRLIGIKSREIYEAPAAMTLIKAHTALESLCLTRDVMAFKAMVEQKFSTLVYDGLWFSPLFDAIDAFIEKTQHCVNGTVKMKCYKGNAHVIGRKSNNSLYQFDLATYNAEDSFSHGSALGFIKLFGLPLEIHAKVNNEYQS
jgi:argininosuccinate synthase